MSEATDRATDVRDAVAVLETRLRGDTGSVVSTVVARREALNDLRSLVRSVHVTVHDPEPLAPETIASIVDALVNAFEHAHEVQTGSRATALFNVTTHAQQLQADVLALLDRLVDAPVGHSRSKSSVEDVSRPAGLGGEEHGGRRLEQLAAVGASVLSEPPSRAAIEPAVSLLGTASGLDPVRVGSRADVAGVTPALLDGFRATDATDVRIAILRTLHALCVYYHPRVPESEAIPDVVEAARAADDHLVRAGGLAVASAIDARPRSEPDDAATVDDADVQAFLDAVVAGVEASGPSLRYAALVEAVDSGVVTVVDAAICQRLVDIVAADEELVDIGGPFPISADSFEALRENAVAALEHLLDTNCVSPSTTVDVSGIVAALAERDLSRETYARALARLADAGHVDPDHDRLSDAVASLTDDTHLRLLSTRALRLLVDADLATKRDVGRLRDRLVEAITTERSHWAAEVLGELAADFPEVDVSGPLPVASLVSDVRAVSGSESVLAAKTLTVLVDAGVVTDPLDVSLRTLRRAARAPEMGETGAIRSLLATLAEADLAPALPDAVRHQYVLLVRKDLELTASNGLDDIESCANESAGESESLEELAQAAAAVVPRATHEASRHAASIVVECVGPELDGVDAAPVVDALAAAIPELDPSSRSKQYELLLELLRAGAAGPEAVPVSTVMSDIREHGRAEATASELLAHLVERPDFELSMARLESTLWFALDEVTNGRDHAADALVDLAIQGRLPPVRVAKGLAAAVRADERRLGSGFVRYRALLKIRELVSTGVLVTAPPAVVATLVALFTDTGQESIAAVLGTLVDAGALTPAALAERLEQNAPMRPTSAVPDWLDSPTLATLALLETASARDPNPFERYAPPLRTLLRRDALNSRARSTIVGILQQLTTEATKTRNDR